MSSLEDLTSSAAARSRDLWLGVVVIVAVVIVAFLPAMFAGFIWDDPDHIVNNQTLRSLQGLWQMWTSFESLPQWYPLTHTTFWIEYHAWGDSPAGYHIDNVLLHAANAVLLWRLLIALEIPGALWGALLFAVHPVTVETVAWASERKNLLSLLFALLSLHAYLPIWSAAPNADGSLARPWFKRSRYWIALALFGAALLSKSVAATLPAAILLLIWWKRGRINFKRDVLPLLPFFALAALSSYNTGRLEKSHVIGPLLAEIPELQFSVLQRLMIAGRACCFYLTKLVWPHDLTFIYPRWTSIDASAMGNLAFAGIVVVGLGILFALRRRIGRGPVTAMLYFCGTLVPALGFVTVYPMRFSFVADHFQYAAMIGPLVLIGAGLHALRLPFPLERTVAISAITILGILTLNRCRDFENILTIWQDTYVKNPNSWVVCTNLAHAMHEQDRDEEAMTLYLQAEDLAPGWWETHMNAADVYRYRRDYDRAIAELHEALRLNPDFVQAHYRLATNLRQKGDLAAAEAEYRQALAAEPMNLNVPNDFGTMLVSEKRYDEAITLFAVVAQKLPREPNAWQYLGAAQLLAGHRDEAIESFRRALAIDPDFAPAQAALHSLGE